MSYKIVRFYADPDRDSEIIDRGLSLEDAQAHCRRGDTHGDGWFDGFAETHGPRCPECGRTFDLSDEIDADDLAYGHDCEV